MVLYKQGTYGKIFKKTNKKDETTIIKKQDIRPNDGIDGCILREIEIIKYSKFPYITPMISINILWDSVHFEMPFYPFSLRKFICYYNPEHKQGILKKYMNQLVNAIHYLHQREIFHNDLKPDNIMIDKEGNIKVIDFGLSNPSKYYFHNNVCSINYRPPELLACKLEKNNKSKTFPLVKETRTETKFDPYKVDIWALGIIFVEMLLSSTMDHYNESLLFIKGKNENDVLKNIKKSINFMILII